jgi:hypothetical protein
LRKINPLIHVIRCTQQLTINKELLIMKPKQVPRATRPLIGWLATSWLFSITPWALAQTQVPAPARCETVYAVHDEGAEDSQFFSYQLKTGTLTPLGDLHNNQDIESLEVDPNSHIL